MKSTIFFAGILLASLTANASTWQLIHSEFHAGSFFCTYKFASYETTIVQRDACSTFIQR
jgi:hypothetical protein